MDDRIRAGRRLRAPCWLAAVIVSGLAAFCQSSALASAATAPDLALSRPAVASSVQSSSYPASAAVDGSLSTRWSSSFSDPQWLYVDLGATYNINEVLLNWETAYGKSYQIQVSTNAVNWTTIYSTTTGTGGVNTLTGLSVTGRYVRMYGTVRGTRWGYSLWKMSVYGTPSGATGPTAPTNLTGTAANGQVSLSWTASTDPGSSVAGYDVYRNGVKAGQTTNTSYTDTGLTNGTTQSYYVTAFDASGGFSQPSNTATATPTVPPARGTPTWYANSLSTSVFPFQTFCPGTVTVATDPVGGTHGVIQMAVPDSCQQYNGEPRVDLFSDNRHLSCTSNPTHIGCPNTDIYISDSVMLPNIGGLPQIVGNGNPCPGEPAPTGRTGGCWFQTDEVYGPPFAGSPPAPAYGVLNFSGVNKWEMQFGNTVPDTQFIGPAIAANVWHGYVVHVRFSTVLSSASGACNGSTCTPSTCSPSLTGGGSTGYTQLWFDGVQQTLLNRGNRGVLSSDGKTLCYQSLGSPNWDTTNHYANAINIDEYRPAGVWCGTVAICPNTSGSVPTIDHGFAKYGTTLASVEPDSGWTGP
jgi:hypothetical protein